MTSDALDSLVRTGLLKAEAPDQSEVNGLIRSGIARLADAENLDLAPESRFDLAYNAAHALSLAALRSKGYRPQKRYVVFQALEHTLAVTPVLWRVLDRGHALRNAAEYEGYVDVDPTFLAEFIDVAKMVRDKVTKLQSIRK